MKNSLNLGVIGMGFRAGDVLKNLKKFEEYPVKLSCVCDLNFDSCRQRLQTIGINADDVKFYLDSDKMLDENQLDGVIIGTHCNLHTQYAVKVLERNINLYLEKPLALTIEDLKKLQDAAGHSTSQILVSLPLRVTHLAKLAKKMIDQGVIGEVQHAEAYNNVAYGDVYYQSWYRNEKETGGLFLQKAVHDFDYLFHIIGKKPKTICAVKSKQIFKGEKPAGQTCDTCDEKEICPQGPIKMKYERFQTICGNGCSFAEDTGNEDSGSAIVLFEDGMHLNYTQNFFCRNSAGGRGAKFFGYRGTLEFDWVKNLLLVHHHDEPRTEEHRFNIPEYGHGGGDDALAYNFIKMLLGKEASCAPFDEAVISNLTCIMANKSSKEKKFYDLEF